MPMALLEFAYVLCTLLLSVYGFNSLLLVALYLQHRHDASPDPAPGEAWPSVTVQLPIYNELHTVERLVQAAASMDYPRDRLEIQVLDDSTDQTGVLASRVVRRLREQGSNVVHITRPTRKGFKAGALAVGTARAKGDLLAIFDADFIPQPDFLRRVVPHFRDPMVGCVQTRWGHLNREYSLLTEAQALGVDGHFLVEQTARSRAGLFINFNGTAGIWRRTCIQDAGGWRADTLTEDLDLSYRAQLRGWRIHYLPDVVVPAELPAQVGAFKRQQARWAQGSIQTAVRLIGPLVRSDQPWAVKLEGIIHLTGYLVHPLMLAMVLLTVPLNVRQSWALATTSWLVAAAVGPPLLYAIAEISSGRQWTKHLRALPLLVLLGTGIALSNTRAVLNGILGRQQAFQRTPKFALRDMRDRWVHSRYALDLDTLVWGELAMAAFALAGVVTPTVDQGTLPWMLLYAAGFAYVAVVSLVQALERQRWLATQPKSGARSREGTP
jgi:cellulose synthase/poly-beta-1,6-N-acetylglucosamine synthase-like glycosyltransferase